MIILDQPDTHRLAAETGRGFTFFHSGFHNAGIEPDLKYLISRP
jgi:hypothetical protein